MRATIRLLCVCATLAVAGGVGGIFGLERVARGHGCYLIDGIWYCPCEAGRAGPCAPPDCILIDGTWYCPDP